MLKIAKDAFDRLRRHAEGAYPRECCGVLTGTLTADSKVVTEAIPAENRARVPRSRYLVEPADLIRIEREARSGGREILGFYHSHPDHPAFWSPTDLAEAHWLGCSYVITSVANGAAAQTRSFRLAGSREEDKRFEEEEIQWTQSSNPKPDRNHLT
jgi:proteasome lid subunit RPN8/RPN11